jgi:hypothetical protein
MVLDSNNGVTAENLSAGGSALELELNSTRARLEPGRAGWRR